MHKIRFLIFAVCLFPILLTGCATATPVKDLTLPSAKIIEGKLISQNASGFILQDASGSIQVKAKLSLAQKNQLLPDETLKIYGNLISGQPKTFDAYVIDQTKGTRIILSNPSPHFGFVLQSSFK